MNIAPPINDAGYATVDEVLDSHDDSLSKTIGSCGKQDVKYFLYSFDPRLIL